MDIRDKHLVLGLTGGIACYKAAELCRALVKEGATVQVVMTASAERFITPVTMQALSNRPVFGSQWDSRESNNMPHINLGREADAILIAPCSADFMSKLVNGGADDLLSLMCLARPIARVPLLLAPAMNREMWLLPATQRNMAQLRQDGTHILGVGNGDQACGETGDGRMLEPAELVQDVIAFFRPKLLAGKNVLVTAGPTYEAIDPVRGITNLSSGKMGFAVARAAREAGAEVTLVAGPVSLATPRGVTHATCMRRRWSKRETPTISSPPRPWPIGGQPTRPNTRSRRMGRAIRRGCNLPRTRTSWLPSPIRTAPKAEPCSASVSRPKARTFWPMPRPNVCARKSRCWSAISAPRLSGRTTTP